MPLDHLDKNAKRRAIAESRKFYWDAPYLYRCGDDVVLRRCVPQEEREEILRKCHSSEYGGHYGHFRTQVKVWAADSIGLRCTRMLSLLQLARSAKGVEIYHKGIQCH
jgi:hypothetical protein